jgi:hypothetical protein
MDSIWYEVILCLTIGVEVGEFELFILFFFVVLRDVHVYISYKSMAASLVCLLTIFAKVFQGEKGMFEPLNQNRHFYDILNDFWAL